MDIGSYFRILKSSPVASHGMVTPHHRCLQLSSYPSHTLPWLHQAPTTTLESLTLSSSSEVGLFVGSFSKHISTKLTNFGDLTKEEKKYSQMTLYLTNQRRYFCTYHFLICLSFGGGFLGMRKRARMGCMLHRAVGKRGGMDENKT